MEFVGLRNFRRLLFAREGGDAVLESVQPQLRFVHDEHNGVTDVNVPLDSEDPTGTRCQSDQSAGIGGGRDATAVTEDARLKPRP